MTDETPSLLANRRVPIAVILGLTLLSGVVHGYLDGRWTKSEDLIKVGQQLKNLPDACGDWTLVESSELKEDAAEMLRCYGSEVRKYQHQKNQALVTVALMFGPRGPIAVHTPEVCYDSIGTKQVRPRQADSIRTKKGTRHQLWSVQFSKEPNPEPSLDVWYAWSDGGAFEARKHPRFWMTENLYKIQLAGPVGDEAQRPCEDFLNAFLPHLDQVIQ